MKKLLLKDDQLMRAYIQAKKLDLDKEFIQLLEAEIEKRNLFEKLKTS